MEEPQTEGRGRTLDRFSFGLGRFEGGAEIFFTSGGGASLLDDDESDPYPAMASMVGKCLRSSILLTNDGDTRAQQAVQLHARWEIEAAIRAPFDFTCDTCVSCVIGSDKVLVLHVIEYDWTRCLVQDSKLFARIKNNLQTYCTYVLMQFACAWHL